jgi:hypothetical protein
MLTLDMWQNANQIALAIGEASDQVETSATELALKYSSWVEIQRPRGFDTQYSLSGGYRIEVEHFLKQLGYTADQTRLAEINKCDAEFKAKQLENLETTTAQAQQAIKNSRFAKNMSWASLGIALAAAIISLTKD